MHRYIIDGPNLGNTYEMLVDSENQLPPFGHYVVADPGVAENPGNQDLFGALVYARQLQGSEVAYHGYLLANLGRPFEGKILFSVKPGEPLVYSTPDGKGMRSTDLSFPSHRRLFGTVNRVGYGRFFSEEQQALHGVLAKVMKVNWLQDDFSFDPAALAFMDMNYANGTPFYSFALGGDIENKLGVAFGAAGIPHWTYWISSLKGIEADNLDVMTISSTVVAVKQSSH